MLQQLLNMKAIIILQENRERKSERWKKWWVGDTRKK